jgi:hypothetical protein
MAAKPAVCFIGLAGTPQTAEMLYEIWAGIGWKIIDYICQD